MEDYFGPRRKGAFDNFDVYDGRNDSSRFRRGDIVRIEEFEEAVVRRPNVLRNQRDITVCPAPPIMAHSNSINNVEEDLMLKYVKPAVSISTLIAENLLSHPFVVLRRQCQVHNCSQRFHLLPVSLLPVIWRLNQSQGLTTLWKGLGSVFLVRGMSLAVEDVISKFTPWPKEFKSHSSIKAHGQHLMLKCLTFAVVTPFYSASLVETVQSDIASEKPGVFDVFREGICRLISWGSPQKGRMLPVWKLVIPSVVYGLLKYLIGIMIRNMTCRILQLSHEIDQRKMGAVPKDYMNQAYSQNIETTASFIALLGTETILYPLETILHRLHLQGTRTIIDNLDSGTHVVPILTGYESALHCYDTTLAEEGVAGLYKGFGALILQFSAHYLLIKLTKTIVMYATHMLHGNSSNQEASARSLNLQSGNQQWPVSQFSPIVYDSSEA